MQEAPWQLRADGSHAAVLRAPWWQLQPAIDFTVGQQLDPDGRAAGRPTPCTADAPLPLDGARRLVRVAGTGRAGVDGVRRTWRFNATKSRVEFQLRLDEQVTAGTRGQLTAHTPLDLNRSRAVRAGAARYFAAAARFVTSQPSRMRHRSISSSSTSCGG